jgi:hypothetical protein
LKEDFFESSFRLLDPLRKECFNRPRLGFDNNTPWIYERLADGRREKLFLEIKVGKINWRGENSLITILTEDLAIERMKYLHEQARDTKINYWRL